MVRIIVLWRDRRVRAAGLQAALTAGLLLASWWVASSAAANLAARGLSLGFGFLNVRAGFAISPALIPFTEASSLGRAFLVGLLNTALVAAIAIPLATALGLMVGVARTSGVWAPARLAGLYVETIRNLPPLLQLFFWYFFALRQLPPARQSWSAAGVYLNNRGLSLPVPTDGAGIAAAALIAGIAVAVLLRRRLGAAARAALALLPALVAATRISWDAPRPSAFNISGGATLTPEFMALVLALAIYQAAYVAETVRAGLNAVPAGQAEAATALGLSRRQALRLVILPQALRASLPPLATIYVSTLKGSTLAAAIAYPDLVSVFAGTVLNLTGRAIEIMAITGAVYLAVSVALAGLLAAYGARLARRGA